MADDFCIFFDALMAKYTFQASQQKQMAQTSGKDVDDRKQLEYKESVEFLYVKSVADKGEIGENLFRRFFIDGIQIITKLNTLMNA